MASERQCDSCGEANPAGSSFCLFCGTYLGWDQPGADPASTQTAPAPGPATPGPSATPQTPPPAPSPASQPDRRQEPAEGSTPPSSRPASDPGPARTPAPTPASAPAAGGAQCPSCGHANAASRRFCERCGFTLVAAASHPAASSRASSTGGSRWWSRSSEERAARRAYRRSLPPLYRWRRVIVTLLVVLLAVGAIGVVEGNPVEWATQRYYDLADETVEVEGVTARNEPGGQDAGEVVDGDPTTYWESPWPAGSPELTACSEATVSLRLTLPDRVRVRGLRVAPGLRPDDEARLARPQPTSLLVSWSGADDRGQCVTVPLDEGPQARDVRFDTETEVDTLWVAIGAVEEPTNVTVERPAAVREVVVLARP